MSLPINYMLLYQFINPLACWFVAVTFYCFPCVKLLNHGMSQHTPTRYTHTCAVACSFCRVRIEFFSGFENRGSAGPTVIMTRPCY